MGGGTCHPVIKMETATNACVLDITSGTNLTEGAMALIERVVERTKLTDPHELLPKVCDELERKFSNDSLDYHLYQMRLQTTEDIVRAISCFFISKQLFPNKRYSRAKCTPISV